MTSWRPDRRGKVDSVRLITIVIAAKRNSTSIATPYFWSEVRFYKFVLGITWRRGRKLIALGVLTPDGYADDRALFLADGQSIQRHRQAIADHRPVQKRRPKPL